MALTSPPCPTEYIYINFIEQQTNVDKYVKLQNEQSLPFAASGIFHSTLIFAEQLTEGSDVKKVIEICVNIESTECSYKPGYTFGILPQNNENEVNAIIERLNYKEYAEKFFHLSVKDPKKKIPSHIPGIGTIRQLLLFNLDIRKVPKKTFLRALSKYANNEEDAEQLNELCSSEKYSEFLTEYICLLELLNRFPSCFPPFTVLLEHLPKLLSRPYSVANSPLKKVEEVKFIFSVTELQKNYKGVCTGWLEKLVDDYLKSSGEKVIKIPVYLRHPNNFFIPNDNKKNLIMVSIGVGIAPFLGFLEHRKLQKQNNQSIGQIFFYYGCRYSDCDFLHKQEVEEYLKNGIITKLYTSFSRETSSNKKYVQDNIISNSKEFLETLFDDNTILFVCGGKKMRTDIFETLVYCIKEQNKCEEIEAYSTLIDLKARNKYIEDIWI